MFALGAPVLAGSVFVAVELSQVTSQQAKLQGIADSAAIAAARELRLGNATKDIVLKVAQSVVDASAAQLGTVVKFSGDVPADKAWISVALSSTVRNSLAKTLGLTPTIYNASARARVMGGAPICAVALEEEKDGAISLEKLARLEARKCAVYSNSTGTGSIHAKNESVITAAMICAAGGKGGGTANFSPDVTTDCPKIPDPLAARPAPVVGVCSADKEILVLSGVVTTLTPGTYCGGLAITAGAQVVFSAGEYVIKDGEFSVDGGASVSGANVGFYFTGKDATLDFRKDSKINLVAPKSGPMTGILFWQAPDVSGNLKYEISSDDAAVLLGTIYLPNGRFFAGGDKPVAQNSAFTIVVAREIYGSAGPTLVLNSDYHLSEVPVPSGVGPVGQTVQLEH